MDSKDNFKLKWEDKDGFPVIHIQGDITASSEKKLVNSYEEITTKINNSNIIIFNFEKVNYINSSGISSIIKLLQMHKNINGDFVFIGLSEHFRKVMDIVGLTDFVSIYDSFSAFKNKV